MPRSRSAKVIILSSGQAMTALVGLLSAVVLTRVLSKLDFATFRQTILAYAFAVPFLTLGFDRALYYFLPGEETRRRGVLVENLLLLLAGGAVLTVFILGGGNRLLAGRFNNPDLAATLLLLAPYPLLMFPASALSACLMARERTEQVAVFNSASGFVMLLAVALPCLFWHEPAAAVLGTVAGGAVAALVALALMFGACRGGDWRPTLSGLRAQALFAVPLGLAGLVGTISQSLDQVLVSLCCSPEEFAVYSVGAMEIPLIGIVTGSITSVVLVDYARFHREGRTSEIVALVHRAMVKSALFLIPAMGFLLCVAPELFRFLFGQAYQQAAAPFRVYLLLLPIRTLTFGAVLQGTGNSRHVLVASALGLAANACLGWVLIHMLGPIGAACGSVAAVYLIVVPYLVLVLRKALGCGLSRLFPWLQILRVATASAASVPILLALRQVLRDWPDALGIAVGGSCYLAVATIFLIALRVVSPGAAFPAVGRILDGKPCWSSRRGRQRL
jgi:O-antigen/teichoic acid export membrane protein